MRQAPPAPTGPKPLPWMGRKVGILLPALLTYPSTKGMLWFVVVLRTVGAGRQRTTRASHGVLGHHPLPGSVREGQGVDGSSEGSLLWRESVAWVQQGVGMFPVPPSQLGGGACKEPFRQPGWCWPRERPATLPLQSQAASPEGPGTTQALALECGDMHFHPERNRGKWPVGTVQETRMRRNGPPHREQPVSSVAKALPGAHLAKALPKEQRQPQGKEAVGSEPPEHRSWGASRHPRAPHSHQAL